MYREWGDSDSLVKNKSQEQQLDRLQKIETQIATAKKEGKEMSLIGDFNLCMDEWSDKQYDWKRLADYWTSCLAENGLKFDNLGTTFESYYTLEKGKVKSALDHYK